MKLTPASTAACSAAIDVSSSTCPQKPPIAHAPKPIGETTMVVPPRNDFGNRCAVPVKTTPGAGRPDKRLVRSVRRDRLRLQAGPRDRSARTTDRVLPWLALRDGPRRSVHSPLPAAGILTPGPMHGPAGMS